MLLTLMLLGGIALLFRKKIPAAREVPTNVQEDFRVTASDITVEPQTFYPEPTTVIAYHPGDSSGMTPLGRETVTSLPAVITESGQTFIPPPPPPPTNSDKPSVLTRKDIVTPKGMVIRPLSDFGDDRSRWGGYISDLLHVAAREWGGYLDESVSTPQQIMTNQLNKREQDFLMYLQLKAISNAILVPGDFGL